MAFGLPPSQALHALGLQTIMLTGDNQRSAEAVGRSVGIGQVKSQVCGPCVLYQVRQKLWNSRKIYEKLPPFLPQLMPEDKVEQLQLCKQNQSAFPRTWWGKAKGPALVGMVSRGQLWCLSLVCFSASCAYPTTTRSSLIQVGDGVNDGPVLAMCDVGVAMAAAGTAVAMETADVALMNSDLTKLPAAIELGRRTKRTIQQNIAFSVMTKVLVMGLAVAGYVHLWLAITVDVGGMLCVSLWSMRLLGDLWSAAPTAAASSKDSKPVSDETTPLVDSCGGGACCQGGYGAV